VFKNLYDSLSLIFSGHWPVATGEITAIDIEAVRTDRGGHRLAIAYKFSVGDDGPYTGESFWRPSMSLDEEGRLAAAKRALNERRSVLVRYRPDDRSVNRLDRSVSRAL
jgi:hypothetical protein